MSNNNEKNFIIGHYSTSSWTYDEDGNRIRTNCINPQLDAWIEAKEKYYSLSNRKHHWGDYKLIIGKLGDSLSDLFGANYTSPNPQTPALSRYINFIFPNEFGWDLKSEDPRLYGDFLELDDYYKDKHKHYDSRKIRSLEQLTLHDLKKFMETTKQMWIWFFKKVFQNNLPPNILEEFQDDF